MEAILKPYVNDIIDMITLAHNDINKSRKSYTSNQAIAINLLDNLRNRIENYFYDQPKGTITFKKRRFRLWIAGIPIGFNKLTKSLKTNKILREESKQLKLALGDFDTYAEVSEEKPIIIGYVLSDDRKIIESINIVCYASNNKVAWSVELSKAQSHRIPVEDEITEILTHTVDNVRIKQPDKKVVTYDFKTKSKK